MGMTYTPLPLEFLEEMEELGDAEYGRLVRWGQHYHLTGEKSKLSGNERFYAKRMQMQIDRFIENYEASVEQRRQAGIASANARQRSLTPVNEIQRDETKPKPKPKPKPSSSPDGEESKNAHARFLPPSMQEVAEYCRERGNSVDAEQFVDFYASKGWKVGNTTMKDWRAAVRTWEKRDKGENAGTQIGWKGNCQEPTGDRNAWMDEYIK